VGALEGFEVVRRRLFLPIRDEAARDKVCREFSEMYRRGATGDFPTECREGAYFKRLRDCYPIHPEVFDRLYDDWSTLERFQKTRGVLRLMAATIHDLWVRQDASLLIMPGSTPLDANQVRDELTRHLSDAWNGVVDNDVDGERSDPYAIDAANPRFGKIMAARRVARAIFVGSAPSVREQKVRGIEDTRIRLGTIQPGEQVSIFNDALGKLVERLTHLYGSGQRYWYDLPPNLRRTVADRAEALKRTPEVVQDEVERRLKAVRERSIFHAVHHCPSSGDVPDEQEARLVVLSPNAGHRKGKPDSPALKATAEILEKRGTSPRQHKNMLLFLAPDEESVRAMEDKVRLYLAWRSVHDEADTLNLDGQQRRQAEESAASNNKVVDRQMNEAYCWLLLPVQEGTKPLQWETIRAAGSESYVAKAGKKVRSNEQVIDRWSPALLKREIDQWLWKDEPHIVVKKLWEYLTTYCYLPRLRDVDVLIGAIQEGLRSRDFFGYAAAVNEEGRYQGLSFGSAGASIYLDESSVLVKAKVAAKQQAEDAEATPPEPGREEVPAPRPTGAGAGAPEDEEPPRPAAPKRFYGTVEMDPRRVGRDAGRVAEEVIQHLAGLPKAKVEVVLEIRAEVPDGVPDKAVRTVTENCRTLKFRDHGFEEA